MKASTSKAGGGGHGLTFLNCIEGDLGLVESRLSDEIMSSVLTAKRAASHILEAGGKRVRPALVILSARACSGEFVLEELIDIAASAELIHMASLMHDDVIDGSHWRRGRLTANAHWGNQASVLTGDYILARAFSLLARSGSSRVMEAIAEAAIAMSESEIRQIEIRREPNLPVESYMAVVLGKTATLMSACCRVGAIFASAPSEQEQALACYGKNLGIAFQITDDLLDLVGNPELTGKPVGSDIREGKVTLPIILTMRKASQEDRLSIQRIISSGEVKAQDIEFVCKTARETGAVDETRLAAAAHITRAEDALCALPPSKAVSSLRALAHYVLSRDR